MTPFLTITGMDDVMGTVGAGIDVITGTDTVLHVTYDGQLGETTQIHADRPQGQRQVLSQVGNLSINALMASLTEQSLPLRSGSPCSGMRESMCARPPFISS